MDSFKYAVEGYDEYPDCPLFTNCTKTLNHAKFIRHRMLFQGLKVVIRPIDQMQGLNPFFEQEPTDADN